MRRASCPLVLTAALLGATGARAQTDPAAAQALFDQAKQLLASGNTAEACPKFLASLKLDPKPGAAVNLADCYEKNGQTASAWARYLEAASLAQRAGQPDREQYAREHAAALEPKLARLTIAAPKGVDGLVLRRDGEPVDAAVWGAPVPVDPGKHVVEASAPGRKPWSSSVDVAVGAQARLDVPALEAAPIMAPPDEPAPSGLGTQRIVGLAIGGVGVAGVAVGAAFGAIALSKWSGLLHAHCNDTTACDQAGVNLAGDAKRAATISTVGFVVGGVTLAGGVVLFATAPKRRAAPAAAFFVSPGAVPGGGGVSAGGVF